MKKIDLHTHSTRSDGLLTPTQLLERAAGRGLRALALTDHDTVAGVEEAMRAGQRLGVRVVPGVEISVDFEPGTFHMLGLGIDLSNPALKERLEFLQQARRDRNPLIVKKLREASVPITLEEVEAEAKGGQVGRPHFAAVLLRKKVVATWEEAFDKWLGKGAPGYMDKVRVSAADAIGMIHQAGGVAVLAHPVQLRLQDDALAGFLDDMASKKLDGIEVYHSDHGPREEAFYLELARRHGLKISGGSDYHGFANKPVGVGVPEVDESVLENLLKP